MRKVLFLLFAALSQLAIQAQKKDTEVLEGNGKLVSRDVPVSSFDALRANGVYELKLAQGSKESVRVEADENLQDLIQVRVEGKKLIVDMKKMEGKGLKVKNKMRVFITFSSLKDLELNMVGPVTSEALSFNDLRLKNRSVGNVKLQLTADKLHLQNNSVGDVVLTGKCETAVVRNNSVGALEAAAFTVQNMDIENNGVGGAEIKAEKDLKVKDSILGKVRNKGAARAKSLNRVRV